MGLPRFLFVCWALALLTSAAKGEKTAQELAREAKKAEKAGKVVDAYLLYAMAAAQAPAGQNEYWLKSFSLRRQAVLQAKTMPALAAGAAAEPLDPESLIPEGPLSRQDLEEVERLKEPVTLKPSAPKQSFHTRGAAKPLWEAVGTGFGLQVIFDGDYSPNINNERLELEDVDLPEAIRAVEALTNSFVVPIGERLFLVARDTPQKRAELETTVAVTLPIPEPVAVQEAQELAQAVRQTMDIVKMQVDSQRRLLLIRDRVSKVRPAELLLTQLLLQRPQVVVELEFLDIAKTSSLNLGLSLPTQFPLVDFGRIWNAIPSLPSGFTNFLTFGGGKTFLGIGITNAQLFVSMSKSNSQSLLRAELRSLDGQAGTLHVGDRYPIATNVYLGATSTTGTAYTPPPTFTFEDLGLTMKITPHVHGVEEVTLEVEADFKVLGAGSYNGIPVISSRKINSKVRMKDGEWGVIAGLMTSTDARTISGLAGLSHIPLLGPLLRQNTRDKSENQVLVLLKPRIIAMPPSEGVTNAFWTGTETKPLSPL